MIKNTQVLTSWPWTHKKIHPSSPTMFPLSRGEISYKTLLTTRTKQIELYEPNNNKTKNKIMRAKWVALRGGEAQWNKVKTWTLRLSGIKPLTSFGKCDNF